MIISCGYPGSQSKKGRCFIMKKSVRILVICLLVLIIPTTIFAGKYGCSSHNMTGIRTETIHPTPCTKQTIIYTYCVNGCGYEYASGGSAITPDHNYKNSGTSERTMITRNASTHTYGFYQHQKCSKCGDTKKYYTTQTSSHTWYYSYTDKKGVKHYRCNCGQTK